MKLDLKSFPVNNMFYGKHRQTEEYRIWQKSALYLLLRNRQKRPLKARSIEIVFHLVNYAITDIDGGIKAFLDILVKSKIIKDDRYITELRVKKVKDVRDFIEFKIK